MAQPTSWKLTERALYFEIFENIPLGQYRVLSTVCKDWNKFFEEKALWIPICKTMLGPKVYQQLFADNSSPDFKAVVKSFFYENKVRMELIVCSFNDDAQLRYCLHSKTLTLQEFKAKSSLDRSRLLWKAWYTDATPILITLVNQAIPWRSRNRRLCTDIASCLIRNHQVPCNMVDVICSAFQAWACSKLTYNSIFEASAYDIDDITVNCIRSHPDLSELENRAYDFPVRGQILEVKPILLHFCNGWIQQGKITRDDLIACKLVQKEENG